MNYVERADTYAHSPFVDVGLTTSYSPATGGFQKVIFDTVYTNENGVWNAVDKWVVFPKAGRIQINIAISFEVVARPTNALLAELKLANASAVYRQRRFGQYNDYGGGFLAITGATMIDVNYNDKLWLDLYTAASAVLTGSSSAGGAEVSYMSIAYLT